MSEEMQLALEHTLKTMRKLKEAKAEIERLRETNEMMLTDIRRTDVDMLAFKAEIERLRADLEAADIAVSRLNGIAVSRFNGWAEQQMLMRENNKLRACLVDIATGQVTELPFIQALARAALAEEKPNEWHC